MSDIQYLDSYPPISLSTEDVGKYYDKIQIYQDFEPYADDFGLPKVIWNSSPDHHEVMTYENFRNMTKNGSFPTQRYIGQKPMLTHTQGYMYQWKSKTTDELDLWDHKILATIEPEQTLYGLHKCSNGLFFKPDIVEIIHLLHTQINLKDLDQIERVYVTTTPYPSNKTYECYDRVLDRHRAKTTYIVLYKDIPTHISTSTPQRKRKHLNTLWDQRPKRKSYQ